MPAVAPVMKTIFEFDMESSWYWNEYSFRRNTNDFTRVVLGIPIRSGADRFPHALLGEGPAGLVDRCIAAVANHTDEAAHHQPHQDARVARLELATRLGAHDDIGEQLGHPLLHRAALGVEVLRVVVQLEESE